MNLSADHQRRMASLARAEAGRTGTVPSSFSSIALARRMSALLDQRGGGVDPVAASAPASEPWLLRA
jgi:hypothetical protein